MSRGGPRVRSGRPLDPNALRRDRDPREWIHLPARREGPVPAWPLTGGSRREVALWTREWMRPQALMWAANGQELEVALYVRSLVAAERTAARTASRTLVRQQMDALGLTVSGLRANLWRLDGDEPSQPAVRPPRAEPQSAKTRLRLLAAPQDEPA